MALIEAQRRAATTVPRTGRDLEGRGGRHSIKCVGGSVLLAGRI